MKLTAPRSRRLSDEEIDLEKQIAELKDELDWYAKRVNLFHTHQSKMRDPERTIVCDILANGELLETAGNRYSVKSEESILNDDLLSDIRTMRRSLIRFRQEKWQETDQATIIDRSYPFIARAVLEKAK